MPAESSEKRSGVSSIRLSALLIHEIKTARAHAFDLIQ